MISYMLGELGLVDIILICTMIAGILCILISYKGLKKKDQPFVSNHLEIENTLKAINSSIDDADNAVVQINNLSKAVFEEFEEKYQELLFLYSLVDEKKKEVSEIYSKSVALPIAPVIHSESKPSSKIANSKNIAAKNPHYNDIMKLQAMGDSISDISKKLNIGQGEVKLILELGKGR